MHNHEQDAAERKRWGARDDAEELYLRRCSELCTHQMLDGFGVPHGELSLNGRLSWLEERLREIGREKIQPADVCEDAKLPELARALPRGEWRIASSGVSMDCGPIRVRCEGGSRGERSLLMRFFRAARGPF